jgi:hypothetical protein
METAKLVITAAGAFISMNALSFTIFQYFGKKREEKDNTFRTMTRKDIADAREMSRQEICAERLSRKDDVRRLETRIEKLEETITENLVSRMANIEGELKSMRTTLQKIQDWFIQAETVFPHTPRKEANNGKFIFLSAAVYYSGRAGTRPRQGILKRNASAFIARKLSPAFACLRERANSLA